MVREWVFKIRLLITDTLNFKGTDELRSAKGHVILKPTGKKMERSKEFIDSCDGY